jgi:hypothetical protein
MQWLHSSISTIAIDFYEAVGSPDSLIFGILFCRARVKRFLSLFLDRVWAQERLVILMKKEVFVCSKKSNKKYTRGGDCVW